MAYLRLAIEEEYYYFVELSLIPSVVVFSLDFHNPRQTFAKVPLLVFNFMQGQKKANNLTD